MTGNGATQGGPAFSCRRCGRCCQGRGGVWLNGQGLTLAARHLGLEEAAAIDMYLRKDGRLWAVRTGTDGRCLLYAPGQSPEAGACAIQAVKPLACRAWPFYWTLLSDPDAFLEAKSLCLGLDDWDYKTFLDAFRKTGIAFPPKSLKKALLGP